MQFILLALQLEMDLAPDTFFTERRPFVDERFNPADPRHTADQHIKVAGKTILKRGHPEQPTHQRIRVCAALEVEGQF